MVIKETTNKRQAQIIFRPTFPVIIPTPSERKIIKNKTGVIKNIRSNLYSFSIKYILSKTNGAIIDNASVNTRMNLVGTLKNENNGKENIKFTSGKFFPKDKTNVINATKYQYLTFLFFL